MARKFLKPRALTLTQQEMNLKKTYGELIKSCLISKGELKCIMHLQPSLESQIYTIKITYKYTDKFPKVWLLFPNLEKVKGKYPHHKYEFDNMGHPRLCVYFPGYREWNPNMDIALSFVPWIITWLYTYEYWIITGKWSYDESPRAISRKDL